MKKDDAKLEALDRVRRTFPADTPAYMVNLLRYRERAAYPEGAADAVATGREAYFQRYLPAFQEVTRGMGIKPPEESDGRADPHPAGGPAGHDLSDRGFEPVDATDHLAGWLDQLPTVLGQRQRVRRAVQQLDTVRRLEAGDRLGDAGRGHADTPAGLGERPRIHDRHEAPQLREGHLGQRRGHGVDDRSIAARRTIPASTLGEDQREEALLYELTVCAGRALTKRPRIKWYSADLKRIVP
ncbi:hypothetical protein WME79_41170 [Sorangium sp. So ce726]